MAKRRNNTHLLRNLFIFLVLGAIGFWGYVTYIQPQYFAPKHIGPLPQGFYSHGIDISHYQGEIDWESFKESNHDISFVYAKATEGITMVDPRWKSNRSGLSEHQIKHGAYHFFIPTLNAQAQAENFLNNYQPEQDDLPPVLDSETDAVSDEELVNSMTTWLSHVERETGRKPLIYTSYNMYKDVLKDAFPEYQFWIANYANRPDRFTDSNIIHWQYSDRGRINGIHGKVDLNYSKIEFEL